MDLIGSGKLDSCGLPDVVGMTHPELLEFLGGLGKERYRSAQVMKWVHQGLADSFQGMTNLSKAMREELSLRARIGLPEVLHVSRSDDSTCKFLLGLKDGHCIETVLIPEQDHDTLCVSTQVGCAMGCRICRTGKMGLKRNLTAGEIVSQLLTVRRTLPTSKITNVVFMGMGEPLANFGETVRAVNILTHPNGPQISWRRLTVSTAGLVPRIGELGQTVRVKLAVSLNAVTDEQRDAIMPINRKYPLAELLAALKDYPLPRRDRITFEYVLIDGFNDSDADARQLVRLLNPIRAKVNLIPLNDEAAEGLKSPKPERVLKFQEILMSRSLMAIIRKSRGRDILAACGQLAAEKGDLGERQAG
ncbi:MAG: 23S rRNA (adenine(2503)-C(2))-methyltransferase RlmN [Desulfomonile tiedjei]|nr:23S rRNA (adenine(2503)-C(2))-methyltransferase RlmN [Desulfomonile tiedjei]